MHIFILFLSLICISTSGETSSDLSDENKKLLSEIKYRAQNGEAGAQYSLGQCYYFGEGVPKDNAEAVKWYLKAAVQGDVLAMTELGVFYEHGWNVIQDWAEAYAYYNVAGIKHDGRARIYRENLRKQMTAAQLDAGLSRSRELQKEIEINNRPTIGSRIQTFLSYIHKSVFKQYESAWCFVISIVFLMWFILTGRGSPKIK
jgi:TPR repeat protein